jgi:hypothetical protein
MNVIEILQDFVEVAYLHRRSRPVRINGYWRDPLPSVGCWIVAMRCACGGELELREGNPRPLHLGVCRAV